MDVADRFDWEGRLIAWSTAGTGPAVVFCHGTPFSSRLWLPFADALTEDFTVYVWDMPGYGQSSKLPEHPVDFDAQAHALVALLSHWGLDGPHVIAHDFGGAVSLRANLVHGAAYSSLMLVDVVAIPPSGSPFFRFMQDHPDVLTKLPAYIHEAIVRRYTQSASHGGLRDDDLNVLVKPWTGDEGQPAFYRQIADYDERFLAENEELLDRLHIPVRILWGVDDAWVPTDFAHKLASLISGATLRLVDSAGHLMHYDAPVGLMSEIRRWLSTVTHA